MRQRARIGSTPRYDAWLANLRTHLAPTGAKTELATFLQQQRGQSIQSWRTAISRILRAHRLPNAETILTINAWTQLQQITDGNCDV